MANCLAQSEALMKGRTLDEATAQLLTMGKSEAEARRLAPHRVFSGNRPSITLAYRKLDAVHAWPPHRALRAPRLRRSGDLGHQRL